MKRMVLLLTMVLLASLASAGDGQWTGYVTDSHCRKAGANARHTWTSLDKCLKGGAKPLLWTDGDESFILADVAKVRDVVGKRLRVSGTLDVESRTITIEKIEVVP